MRRLLLGALVGAGLLVATLAAQGLSDPPNGPSQTSTQAAGDRGGLITHMSGGDGPALTLTVIDPRERWIGVYQIERGSGAITLQSARNITWDTQLIDLNSGKPLPQDIRSALPR
jgi:hypothetical protein